MLNMDMDGFTLDSNTVKDCAEPAPAVRTWESRELVQSRKGGLQIQPKHFHTPMCHESEVLTSERYDSAYGSECYSSSEHRSENTGDVSDRFQKLRIRPQERSSESHEASHYESERTVCRPQKRPAEEIEDEILLTNDAYDQDEEGDTPLAQAIIYEKPDIALKFIRFTTDPSSFNIRNCLGQTALMLSVLTNQAGVCRALVVAGACVDIQDQEGNTALHLACRFKNFTCVQALTGPIKLVEIKKFLSPRNHRKPQNLSLQLGLKNYEGLTCVHLATFQGNINLLQYLVALGADINDPDGKSGRTALHYAVEMNLFNLVSALITVLNANVDAVTFDLCTPLHLAAGRGNMEIAYMLHGAGSDTQVQNFEGQFAYELTNSEELKELIMPTQHLVCVNMNYL